MCTLSVIRTHDNGGALRLAFSRDELLSRPRGEPPRVVDINDGGRAVLPVDPQSGGTWIAVTDRGLAMAVLNVNPPAAPRPAPRTRGEIIPTLLHCDDAAHAVGAAVAGIEPTLFAPFRLVLLDAHVLAAVTSDGTDLAVTSRPIARLPAMFTSSGLGDHVVEPARRDLYVRTLAISPSARTQDAFHRHQWPDRPHLSVRMSRAGAATVSYTVVELRPTRATLHYTDGPPVTGDATTSLNLNLQEMAVT